MVYFKTESEKFNESWKKQQPSRANLQKTITKMMGMEKTLLFASAKDEIVKILGLEVANVRLGKLHFKINGVDLMRDIVIDEIEISADVEPPKVEEKK